MNKIEPEDAARALRSADNDLLDGWDKPHFISFPGNVGYGSHDAGFAFHLTDAETKEVSRFYVKVYAVDEEEDDE